MEMFKKIKNLLLIGGLSILVIAGIFLILNIAGGINVNKKHLLGGLDESELKDTDIGRLSMKLGLFNTKLTAKSLKLQKDNITLGAEGFGVRKTWFSGNVSEIFLENGDMAISIKEEANLKDAFIELYNAFSSKKKAKAILLSKMNISVIKSSTTFKMTEVNLKLEEKKSGMEVKGTFVIGHDTYTLMLTIFNKANIDFRLESDNIAFKMNLNDNAGNALLSINNITEFLNTITPDTINIDLGYFDGQKNTIYFKSNISYNDVRKSMEFSNSKVQFYSDAEREIKIDTLSNNSYKVVMDLPEITVTQVKEKKNFIWGETKVPVIQFGKIFPDIKILWETRIGKIKIADEKSPFEVDELKISSSFEAGRISFDSSFLYNKKFQVSLEGFMQNFESVHRKGFVRAKVDGREVNLSNINLFDAVNYQGKENTSFTLNFDATLAGDTLAFDNINVENEGDIHIISSNASYNLYKKDGDYLMEINADNIDFDKIKFILPNSLTQKGQELFRVIFQYLSFKSFTYINLSCTLCKAGDEKFDIIRMQYSLTPGKMELEKLDMISPNIQASLSGILDIRDAAASILNMDIFIKKWKGVTFPKLLSVWSILKNGQDFQIPSLQSFSGVINFEGADIETEGNKIRSIDALFSLNRGFLKSVNSEITLNGVSTKDFLKTESSFYGNVPAINLSLAFGGIKLKEIIGFFLKDTAFDKIDGTASIGFSSKTTGFLFKDLMKNSFSNLELKSGDIKIKNFNIDALSAVMRQGKGYKFKNFANSQNLHDIMNSDGLFSLNSTWRINGMEVNIESMELKSLASDIPSTMLVAGKYSPAYMEVQATTAMAGANLNKKLEGIMPVYLRSFITWQPAKLETKIDYTQINKYYEVRKVLDE